MNRLVFKSGRSTEINLLGYTLDGYLGDGAYSVVNRATQETTGDEVAIKFIERLHTDVTKCPRATKVAKEFIIMGRLKSPHIIQLVDFQIIPSLYCIVMEYAPRGDLFSYLDKKDKLDEDEARQFFRQLISGVEFCHQNKVVHRDLKLENLLLDENLNLKISDFGLSSTIKDDCLVSGSCGSPQYVAPEVLSGHQFLGPPTDVWSCGVILFTLLCGQFPFPGRVSPAYMNRMETLPYTPDDEDLSHEVQELMEGMLVGDPAWRLTIPQIIQHPWLQA